MKYYFIAVAILGVGLASLSYTPTKPPSNVKTYVEGLYNGCLYTIMDRFDVDDIKTAEDYCKQQTEINQLIE